MSPENQNPIVVLVDRILAARRKNPPADTSALEREIDQLVYKLYGLAEEEIAIVDGGNRRGEESARAGIFLIQ